MPDFDHNEFYRRRGYEEYYPDQMRERPSEEIKVRIRPNQKDIPKQLTTELRIEHNMELSQSNSNRDIVIISGIPHNNGFGEREVLEVIRKYARNAEVVRESSQQGGRRR